MSAPVSIIGRLTAVLRPAADGTELVMIQLPSGTFHMGAVGQVDDGIRDIPGRLVKLTGFSMAKYAVSRRLYHQTVGRIDQAGLSGDLPMVGVTFEEAIRFCNALSGQLGFSCAYAIEGGEIFWRRNANGFRLPTEAEWEYAARGTAGRAYPWGEETPGTQVCWCGEGNDLRRGNRKGPSPIWSNSDGATPDGILSLAGSVYEWCWDWYAPYRIELSPLTDPIGPKECEPPLDHPAVIQGRRYRVMRGGAWNTQDPKWLRGSARVFDDMDVRDPDVGFRVVRGAIPAGGVVA